jgi:hypothetical protein
MSEVQGAVPEDGLQRVGDTEREAAVTALDAHRAAGRLDATEYEDRQVRISRARTWAEIQPLFEDLPDPHPIGMPQLPGGAVHVGATVGSTGVASTQPTGQSVGLLGNVIPERFRSTIMALTPLLAVVLFFKTETWLWFLAIPIMAILLYGPEDRNARRRDRNRRRG